MSTEAVQRVIDHIERHKGRERAMFSIAGLQAVLEENDRLREALRRLIDTYKDMQDGDGNPCPDVAFAREALNGGSDAG